MSQASIYLAGVTYEGRQDNLKALYNAHVASRDTIVIKIVREKNNSFDLNAIKIKAKCKDKGEYLDVGYVPREIAKAIIDSIGITEIKFTFESFSKFENAGGKECFGMKIGLTWGIDE